ncbi:MAG: hypothetical protein OEU26_25835 [Candidatus Tectomicrobia bacterium]|nr:hypothetical protein [Candidatus Tectomicrobia bacterium]
MAAPFDLTGKVAHATRRGMGFATAYGQAEAGAVIFMSARHAEETQPRCPRRRASASVPSVSTQKHPPEVDFPCGSLNP